MEKVAFASDHAGYELKEVIKKYMEGKGYDVVDFGTDSEESCDYADYAHPAASAVEKGECSFGIAMCGSGNGIGMTLNKHNRPYNRPYILSCVHPDYFCAWFHGLLDILFA